MGNFCLIRRTTGNYKPDISPSAAGAARAHNEAKPSRKKKAPQGTPSSSILGCPEIIISAKKHALPPPPPPRLFILSATSDCAYAIKYVTRINEKKVTYRVGQLDVVRYAVLRQSNAVVWIFLEDTEIGSVAVTKAVLQKIMLREGANPDTTRAKIDESWQTEFSSSEQEVIRRIKLCVGKE